MAVKDDEEGGGEEEREGVSGVSFLLLNVGPTFSEFIKV